MNNSFQGFTAIGADLNSPKALTKSFPIHSKRGLLIFAWSKAVGKAAAMNSFPLKVKGDTLLVVCSSSVWAQELTMMQSSIVKKLRELLDTTQFKKLHCFAGTLPENCQFKTSPKTLGRHQAPNLDEQTRAQIDAATAIIEDSHVRQAAANFYAATAAEKQAAIREGKAVCPRCGEPNSDNFKICPLCRLELVRQSELIILQRLVNEPWLKRDNINQALDKNNLPTVSISKFYDIKNHMVSEMRRQAWRIMNTLPKDEKLPDHLRSLLIEMVLLCCEKMPDELTEGDILFALKKRLADSYLNDSAPDPTIWKNRPRLKENIKGQPIEPRKNYK